MRREDPDAMWRPGYTGSFGYLAPPTARRRRRTLAAVSLVVVATTLAVAGLLRIRTDDPAPDAGRHGVPDAAVERWSVAVDDITVRRVVGTSQVVVLDDATRHVLVGLDARSGVERWRAPTDIDVGSVIAGHFVGVATGPGARRTLTAIDVTTGELAWTRPLGDRERLEVGAGDALVVETVGERQRVGRLDAATGDVGGRIEGAALSWSRSEVVARDGGVVRLYERASFDPIGEVDLAALGMTRDDVAVAVSAAGTIIAGTSEVVLVDRHGERTAALSLSAPTEGASRVALDVLDADGRFVALQQGDHLAVLAVEPELRALWSTSAWLVDWHVDDVRRLVAVATTTGSSVALPPQVLDLLTGRPAWDGPASVQDASPLRVFGADGFIAVRRSRSADPAPVVVAYDLDRSERWRRRIGAAAWPTLVDAGLVTVEQADGSDAVVTLYA